MKKLAFVILVAVLSGFAVIAAGQICPDTPAGYVRQYRPEGIPANYPPETEPSCYMIDTQSDSRVPGCAICHHNRSLV